MFCGIIIQYSGRNKPSLLCKGRWQNEVLTEGLKIKYNYNKSLVNVGRMLRKNMTKEERHLWYDFLREQSVRFIRQKIIGNYIVDFYCAKANLAIELDGSQHYDEAAIIKDNERTKYLESQGLKVIRISNNEINNNFRGVCEFIYAEIEKSTHL
ncbi:MAG: endonuclease domain-containing protein [Ruminococcaceae bacterium]|nr:endonuclease domain-containing protein [Oscillospiraceae bacterium]